MDQTQTSKVLALLAGGLGREYTREQAAIWHECLADLEAEHVHAAVIAFLTAGDDWPTPAKIRRLAVEQRDGLPEPAEAAFERLMRAVRCFGSYDKARALEALDPLTRSLVEGLGGWLAICSTTTETRGVLFGQFRRAYDDAISQQKRLAALPEAVRPRLLGNREYIRRLTDRAVPRIPDNSTKVESR